MFVLASFRHTEEDMKKERKKRWNVKGGLAEGWRLRRHSHICPYLTSRYVVPGLAH